MALGNAYTDFPSHFHVKTSLCKQFTNFNEMFKKKYQDILKYEQQK